MAGEVTAPGEIFGAVTDAFRKLRRGHGASRDRFCSHRSRRDLALPHHGEASAAGDIVVVTVPVKAFPGLAGAPLAGKTVIDTCNYGPERDGHIPELDGKSLTSSELLLRYIPDAILVKAFNNIFFKHLLSLARPAGAADRSYLPITGDSAPAKAAVTEFIDSIGYSVVDAGSVADSWRQATGTPVWGTPYGPYSNENGQPAGEDAIRAALATATR